VIQWHVSLDSDFAAWISSSITISGDYAYVGISSYEEAITDLSYNCCTFRGSLVKFSLLTKTITWKWYTVPDNHGNTSLYAGVSIWGSAPSVDITRNRIYVATGNNYHVPDYVAQCQLVQNNKTIPDSPDPCIEADNYVDSVVALDLTAGTVVWAKKVFGYDTYMNACFYLQLPNRLCENPAGPDYDFPQEPMLVPSPTGDLVVVGQKTGFVWAFQPDTGNITWSTFISPPGKQGGVYYGCASDGVRVYGAGSNSNNLNYTLMNGSTITSGSWSAMNASTGKLIWQTPDPLKQGDKGALTVANGILYGGSNSGHLYALNANTGAVLWSYTTSSAVSCGPSVVDGDVYWGGGGGTFYAFSVNGQ